MNITEHKSRKQSFTLRGADLHATSCAKEVMFVHVELPDARRLIQPSENLIDNIADRQVRRIDKIQGTIFVTIINATHTQTTENFEFVFRRSDSGPDAATSEYIAPVGFYWADTGHLICLLVVWIYIGLLGVD